ncbi:4Fe-4S ferredoxin iron-sulfur binding domain protein [Dethiosulfovibrio peptidovorans DSM 11002]|uniref:4Fe-4S ferredoxin iron-sulfur binding domain protein n=1 Tax=Dethiosulfovibrio peptidovorans DSM 11002 TaxID=469381 RepID=D2Z6T1_9BACT|nr:4Fe-4S binding protein [Dethiosulfovibrio peptidovorans]EFC91178.1 4Fe-4S ferredoxin iron-sulfur binding domain protein [Dethiosulfovibrio peptidovorans DSM 11002]
MEAKVMRRIITIDKDKCDGCGLCAEACHEGAIRMIDGKAELVSESYCDGLGDCIGECPRGAITFEEREASPYDEEAVERNVASTCSSGCPGTMARSMGGDAADIKEHPLGNSEGAVRRESALRNWPVQLKLVPENAPYLSGSHLVIAADCSALAHPDFHRSFLGDGKVCLMGCPKLDDAGAYRDKLARIMAAHSPKAVTVIHMEVPCCGGMVRLVESAIEEAKADLDYTRIKIAIEGGELERESTRYRFSR